jgi:DNA-binding CsgD family transcriptional regulator
VVQVALALLVCGAERQAWELEEALREDGRRRGSLLAALNAAAYAGALHSRGSDLAAAEGDIRIAVDMLAAAPLGLVGMISVLCFGVDAVTERTGLADVGDLALATDIPPDFARTATGALVHELKATILTARGERDAAIAQLRGSERIFSRIGVGPRTSIWRSRLAVLLRDIDSEEAKRLATDELDAARRLADLRSEGIALRALGLVEGGAAGLERFADSVERLERAGARLELARSLAALGAGLRRGNHRSDAREKLREALELAREVGAQRLEDEILDEIRIAGGRLRRRDLSGAGSLTPAELRVVAAAASGTTNREIAQDLFVSLRTVEMHLTNAYAKLGISSRGELAAAIGE